MARHPQANATGPGRRPVPDRPAPARAGPVACTNFRVFIGGAEIGLCAVSPLHWGEDACGETAPAGRVTLRRAVGRDRRLFDWRRALAHGRDDARTVVIVLLDGAGGDPVSAWTLADARPVRWSGPELDALSNGIAFEELEITYEDMTWQDGP